MKQPQKKTLLVLLTIAFGVIPAVALAAAQTYSLLAPLGPLGKDGAPVTMVQYLEGIVLVIIGIAGILTVIKIVICGVQLIGSPSVSQKSESKECITSALFGLLLAISSWIILNTINTQLLSSDIGLLDLPALPAAPAPAAGDASLPPDSEGGVYFRYQAAGANSPITNSPRYEDLAACTAGKKSELARGSTILKTPAGSEAECFKVFKGPNDPAKPTGDEQAVREKICANSSCHDGKLVDIKQEPCPTGIANCVKAGYINVVGMPDSVITEVTTKLPQPVVITGGTESGHQTHKPASPIFDLRKSPTLDTYIRTNSTQSAASFVGCRYLLDNFWFTDEGDHWHVCEVNQPYWFCTNKSRNGDILTPGTYANCPRK